MKFEGFCYDAKNARHHESGKLLTLKIPKRRRQRLTVCFRTRFDTDANKMMYAVKAGRAAAFQKQDWQASCTSAWTSFHTRNGLSQSQSHSLSGPKLFGFRCDEVQAHLIKLRAPETILPKEGKKVRGHMRRVPIKTVAGQIVKSAKQNLNHVSPSSSSSSSSSSSTEIQLVNFGEFVLVVREPSCRCVCCLEHRWTDCWNTDAGENV